MVLVLIGSGAQFLGFMLESFEGLEDLRGVWFIFLIIYPVPESREMADFFVSCLGVWCFSLSNFSPPLAL